MTISATPPSVVPRWATNASRRVEPSEAQKDTGWTAGQRPTDQAMNWLHGIIYDWQQYLKLATDQLESSKINKTGATDLSGAFTPTSSGGASFGSNLRPLSLIVSNQLQVKTNVVSELTPSTTDTFNLGQLAARWKDVYAQQIFADTASFSDLSAGNLSVVNASVSRATQPSSASTLAMLNQLNNIVAWVDMTGAGTSTATSTYAAKKYNVSGTTAVRAGPGSYTVSFNTAIPTGCIAFVSCPDGGTFRVGRVAAIGTTSINVVVGTVAGPAVADGPFSLVVIGPVA